MAAEGRAETLLMFLEREKALIPVSEGAFKVTQNTLAGLRRYDRALLVSRDGHARRVARIDVQGLWGESFGCKMLSALTGARVITVHFDAVPEIQVGQVKQLVSEYLRYDQERPEPYLPQTAPVTSLLARIATASSVAEIFEITNVPGPEDALDVL